VIYLDSLVALAARKTVISGASHPLSRCVWPCC
jgi:hypothetical protein